MLHQITAVGFDTEMSHEQAKMLAEQLNLIVDNQVLPRLSVMTDKLVLLVKNFSPLFVDFSPLFWQKRRDAGKKQGLVRACRPLPGVRILDATAGWGRDAAVLASFGAEVLMLERHPVIAALLSDGLRRMLHQPATIDFFRNATSSANYFVDAVLESSCAGMHTPVLRSVSPHTSLAEASFERNLMALSLLNQDAMNYLPTLAPRDFPDVIYIDPMHPLRQKSALVKKDMQALQQIIGEDKDVSNLIELAMTRTRQRVVVKWPQRLAPLLPPHASISGKTVRFDIYAIS